MYGPCKGHPFVYASEIESVILVQLLLLVSGLIFFHFSILKYLLLTNISEFELQWKLYLSYFIFS